MGNKIERLQINLAKRNARKRGPTSSDEFNDNLDEIAQDTFNITDQWNNRLLPLTSTIPDGTDDEEIDAYLNGLAGDTLYVDADATASVNPTYFNSIFTRPNTIFEQMVNIYLQIGETREDLENQVNNQLLTAGEISILDTASILAANNVEDALNEIKTSLDLITVGSVNFSSVAENILPSVDITYNIGSPSLRWSAGYFGPDSVHISSKTSDPGHSLNKDFGISVNSSTGKLQFLDGVTVVAEFDASSGATFPAGGGGGGGDVTKVGTPINNQIGVWTGDGTIEGDAGLIWDGSSLGIGVTPTVPLHINTITDAAGPTIFVQSNVTGTNAASQGLGLRLKSTAAAITDGFGPEISFGVGDSVGDSSLGTFGMERAGADNTGDFVWNPNLVGSESERMRLSAAGRLGIGTVLPGYTLDVETADVTIAKFGTTNPLYFITQSPTLAYNAYFSSGWKFGKGSSSHYGGSLSLSQSTGEFGWQITSAVGNADAAATMVTRMKLLQTGELHLSEIASGATPDSGFGAFYVKTDGIPYFKNDSGTEFPIVGDRTASGLRTASGIVSISAATAPTAGQILKATNGTLATWVTDPAVQNAGDGVDNRLAVWTSATSVQGLPGLVFDGEEFLISNAGVPGIRMTSNAGGGIGLIEVDGGAVMAVGSTNGIRLDLKTSAVVGLSMRGSNQDVAIGPTAAATGVKLDVQGTTGAFRAPTLNTTQRDALTPLAGMQIYNSSAAEYQFYNSGWVSMTGGGSSTLDGLSDVVISTPVSGHHIIYNGTQWQNEDPSVSTAPSAPLYDVTDVKTTNYSAIEDEFVRTDPSGGGFTVSLPVSAGSNVGRTIVVKNITSSVNTVTVDVTGGQLIDGLSSVGLGQAFGSTAFMSYGDGWGRT